MKQFKRLKIAHILLIGAVVIFLLFTFGCGKKEPKEIKIGAILPLTGNDARYGLWIKEGLDLCVDEVNSSGGINGKRVRIIYEECDII